MAVPVKITSPVMKVDEVCKLPQIHRATLYQRVKAGAIPAFRMGSEYRFNREEIDQWWQAQERKSTR